MRNDQLNILLKHGDIMTMDFIYKDAPESERQHFENHRGLYITIEGVDYVISKKVIELFYKLFHSYASIFIDSMRNSLKRTITEQLKYLPKEKEDKKEMLNDLIREKKKRLEKLIGPITHLNTVEYWKKFYFFSLMKKSILELITYLKFDILNGKKIDFFKFDNAPNMGKLNDYFLFDYQLMVIYQTIAIEENIEELIADVEKSNNDKNRKEKATIRETIIAYNFKVAAGLEKEKKAPQWRAEIGGKAYTEYYTLIKQSKNYKPPTSKELTAVIPRLEDSPNAQKMAINQLESIKSF